MAEQLRAIVEKAAKENLSVLQAVDRLCDEEKASRLRNAVDRRIRCGHRPMPITDSGASRSLIPVEADHRFRSKPIAERIAR